MWIYNFLSLPGMPGSVKSGFVTSFGRCPIVCQKNDKSIFISSGSFKFMNKFSNSLVQPVDHRRMGFHVFGFPFFFFAFFPCFARFVGCRFCSAWVNYPQLNTSIIPFLPQYIPAFIIHTFVFCNVLRKCMQRPMWCGVGNIQKNRVYRLFQTYQSFQSTFG